METNPSFPRVFIHPRYTYAYWEEFSSRGKEVSRLRRPPSLAIVARRRTTFTRKSILLIHKLKSFLPIMLYFYINTSIVVGRWRNRAETIIPFYSFPQHPSIRNPQKHSLPACFSYFSIHTTCQPIVNHYCTFFSRYDIFFFLLYFF